jgi:phosphoribosylformylglycinamidine synthase
MVTGFTTTDDRVTNLMPHLARVLHAMQQRWTTDAWREHEDALWLRLLGTRAAGWSDQERDRP